MELKDPNTQRRMALSLDEIVNEDLTKFSDKCSQQMGDVISFLFLF